MGILDRAGDIAGSIAKDGGDILSGVLGGVWDFTSIPIDLTLETIHYQDEYEGFFGTIKGVGIDRVGSAAGNLFGPDEGLGAFFRLLPEWGRSPIGDALQQTMDDVELWGDRIIRRPIATVALAGSLSDSTIFNDGQEVGAGDAVLNLFEPRTWRKAYDMADDTSPGEALWLMGTRDILSTEEIASWYASDLFHFASGSTDLAIRLYYEPDLILGRAIVNARRVASGAALARVPHRGGIFAKLPTGNQMNLEERIAAQFHILDDAGSKYAHLFGGKQYLDAATNQRLLQGEAAASRLRGRRAAKAGDQEAADAYFRLADQQYKRPTKPTAAEKVDDLAAETPDQSFANSEELRIAEQRLEGALTRDLADIAANEKVLIRGPKFEQVLNKGLPGKSQVTPEKADEVWRFLREQGVIGNNPGKSSYYRVLPKPKNGWVMPKQETYIGIEGLTDLAVLETHISTGTFQQTLSTRAGRAVTPAEADAVWARLEELGRLVPATPGSPSHHWRTIRPRLRNPKTNKLDPIDNVPNGGFDNVDDFNADQAAKESARIQADDLELEKSIENLSDEDFGILYPDEILDPNVRRPTAQSLIEGKTVQSKYTEAVQAARQAAIDRAARLPHRRFQAAGALRTTRFKDISHQIFEWKKRGYSNEEVASFINTELLKGHHQGDQLSYLLAHAEDAAEQEHIWRVAMGDLTANEELLKTNSVLAAHVEEVAQKRGTAHAQSLLYEEELEELLRIRGQSSLLPDVNDPYGLNRPLAAGADNGPMSANAVFEGRRWGTGAISDTKHQIANSRSRLQVLEEQVEALEPLIARAKHMEDTFAKFKLTDITRRPIRGAYKQTTFYQTSRTSKVLRTTVNNIPHATVSMADTGAGEQFRRFLRTAGHTDETWRAPHGEFLRASFDERKAIYYREEQNAITKLGRDNGLSHHEIEDIISSSKKGHEDLAKLLADPDLPVRYDSQDRAIITINDETGMTMEIPLMTSQLEHTVATADWKLLKREIRNLSRIKYGDDFAARVEKVGFIKAKQFYNEGSVPSFAAKRREAVSNIARTAKNTGADKAGAITVRGMEQVMKVWKPMVLLRPAWTVRVILMDEQFRMIAKFGALESILGRGNDFRSLWVETLTNNPRLKRMLASNPSTKGVGGAMIGGLVAGPAGAMGGALGGYSAGTLLSKLAAMEKLGYPGLSVNGFRSAQALGMPGETAAMYEELASSSSMFREFLGTTEQNILEGLRPIDQKYRTYTWNAKPGRGKAGEINNEAYTSEWVNLFRKQVMNDDVGKQLLEGKTREEVLHWLENTPEGINHASRMPSRGRHSDGRGIWMDNLTDQIDEYTGFDQNIRTAILELPPGATFDDYAEILQSIPNEFKPVVHGRAFEEVLGIKDGVGGMLDRFVESAFKTLAAGPTDNLSRMPAFRRFYEAEMQRTLGSIPKSALENGQISLRQLEGFEEQSRRFALKEMRELMYDLAEQSEFAEMTRLIMPFFPAYQEVLTRWAGLIYENPNIAFMADEIWRGPSRMGITYEDESGEEYIQFRIPNFAKALLSENAFFANALDSQDSVRFRKDSFNMVAQGTPGFGPWATAPVSIIAKERPELEDSLKFIIPYGPQGFVESFKAPNVARLISSRKKDDDRAYLSAKLRIMQTELTNMQINDEQLNFEDPIVRGEFMARIDKQAAAFSNLRLVAGLFSPVTPVFDSPYQLHIDIYRAIRNRDFERAQQILGNVSPESTVNIEAVFNESGDSADAVFLQVFGEEYFSLTQAFTQTMDGVPPTLQGAQLRDTYKGLIETYPEWGGVIAGYEGGEANQFVRSMYERQLETPITAGSDVMQREALSPLQILQGPDIRLGWDKFTRAMDGLEAVRIERGLPNYSVKGAADLAAYKAIIVQQLKAEHPQWGVEYSNVNLASMATRLEGANAILQSGDSALLGRADIQGLSEYMELRAGFITLLEQRQAAGGARTLDASANQDVRYAWESQVLELVERNLAFADIYYRRFQRDLLDVG
tara:strand:+ start:460 stop:6462 length:6003 start_codon:yes stop_codon:yes gene_type:complete